MPLPTVRCCKICEITMSIDNFNSNRNKNNRFKGIDSRRHRCKTCEKIQTKAYNTIYYQNKKLAKQEKQAI